MHRLGLTDGLVSVSMITRVTFEARRSLPAVTTLDCIKMHRQVHSYKSEKKKKGTLPGKLWMLAFPENKNPLRFLGLHRGTGKKVVAKQRHLPLLPRFGPLWHVLAFSSPTVFFIGWLMTSLTQLAQAVHVEATFFGHCNDCKGPW